MSTIWLKAVVPNPASPICLVYLGVDLERRCGQVTRILVTEIDGRMLPLGIDKFDSESEAKGRCMEDFGIECGAWLEMPSEPEFFSVISAASEKAIENLTQFRSGLGSTKNDDQG